LTSTRSIIEHLAFAMAVHLVVQSDRSNGVAGSFDKILHQGTTENNSGLSAMLKKDHEAQRAAADEYFRHWDNKKAQEETVDDRAARTSDYASLTRQ
jgi:DNA transposition AAA+ family ATPase